MNKRGWKNKSALDEKETIHTTHNNHIVLTYCCYSRVHTTAAVRESWADRYKCRIHRSTLDASFYDEHRPACGHSCPQKWLHTTAWILRIPWGQTIRYHLRHKWQYRRATVCWGPTIWLWRPSWGSHTRFCMAIVWIWKRKREKEWETKLGTEGHWGERVLTRSFWVSCGWTTLAFLDTFADLPWWIVVSS